MSSASLLAVEKLSDISPLFFIGLFQPMYITWHDIEDVVNGKTYLNISVMHFWMV
ncbi:hypothetical protein Fmac_020362 [Flemingia macrophylla]|uniref:Uncharacterized protein n=1 Tax=Flemingia macrophylla TaxID=520843 RepID=A0ABD1LTV5_9FABA